MRKLDITDIKFGKLRAIERVGTIKGKSVWLLECSCGNKTKKNLGDLRRKDSRAIKSCGCDSYKKGEESPHWKGSYGISAKYFNHLKDAAKSRGIVFRLSYKYLRSIYDLQKGLCRYSNKTLILNANASVDRIDSSKGYIEGNVQWVDKRINKLKGNFKEKEFLKLVKEIQICIEEDSVDESTAEILDIIKSSGTKVIICTGRDAISEYNTKKWLKDNGIEYDEYHTRAEKDMRPDWVIKEEMWRDIAKDYHIVGMFDDRLQVTRRARALGLKVFNVEYGNF